VLKPSGSLWVNLGDKYAGGGGYSPDSPSNQGNNRHGDGNGGSRSTTTGGNTYGMKPKSLMGLPWRYAIGCIDQLDLILRAEIVWSKPNGLPESVTDRVRRSHEQWFHFTKEPRYFSAVDEVREEYAPSTVATYATGGFAKTIAPGNASAATRREGFGQDGDPEAWRGNPLGKLPGSVWTIPTEPLRVPDHLGVDHFAAFPSEWPRRIILGWSPSGVCVECGEGRRPVVAKEQEHLATRSDRAKAYRAEVAKPTGANWSMHDETTRVHATITGYACACPDTTAPTRPSVVLDPFSGTGTTPAVAHILGRHGIGIDLSADYLRLAEWRCNDPALRAKVLRVDKPKAVIDGQLDIFAADVASGDETTVG